MRSLIFVVFQIMLLHIIYSLLFYQIESTRKIKLGSAVTKVEYNLQQTFGLISAKYRVLLN
ncbi:hypothetical protein VK86_07230 [Moellerella wisconsensis]|nr:hypothetical protein VK86_07230 [Moellerella wisconsensis]